MSSLKRKRTVLLIVFGTAFVVGFVILYNLKLFHKMNDSKEKSDRLDKIYAFDEEQKEKCFLKIEFIVNKCCIQ